ncbi:MAG: hypothetical protein ACYC9L_10025 [Sulfuricaulis sp.]
MGKKTDARKLGPPALQLLRQQAVQAVRGGMTQTEAARMFGASLRVMSDWMRLDREDRYLAKTKGTEYETIDRHKNLDGPVFDIVDSVYLGRHFVSKHQEK